MSTEQKPTDEQIAVAQALVGNILRDVEREVSCPRWLVAYEMVVQGLAALSGRDPDAIRQEGAENAFAIVEGVLRVRGTVKGNA